MSRERAAFGAVAPAEWVLHEDVPATRRARLFNGLDFVAIVSRMAEEMTVASVTRRKSGDHAELYRVVATLNLAAPTVDLFHSSATGYRAQYYLDPELGEQGAVRAFVPQILAALARSTKRTSCPVAWAERTLMHSAAKVWIHQGLWWRHAKRSDRVLLVKRWLERQNSSDRDARRKARWGALAPDVEDRIVVKGVWCRLGDDAEIPPTHKPARARDIRELGFT